MTQLIQRQSQKQVQKLSIKDFMQSMQSSVNKILSQSEKGLFELLHQLQNIADIIDNHTANTAQNLQKTQSIQQLETDEKGQEGTNKFFISQIQTEQNQQKDLKSEKNHSNFDQMNIKVQKQQNQFVGDTQNQNSAIKITGPIKIGQLQKKKQQLMKKLKAIDQQLYQSHQNQSSLNSSLFKNKSTIPNQSRPMVYSKAKKQNTAVQHCRTLQILESFNNQKIRRHQQMIQKMKFRQQQEMKKIEQLQTRKIQIQLKRSRYVQDKIIKNKSQVKVPKIKQQNIRG